MSPSDATHAASGLPAAKVGFTAALKDRQFMLLWSGQTLSSIGNFMFPVALAMMVLKRGSGAVGLGYALGAHSVAIAIGTIGAATVGDRWRRTRIMLGADALRAMSILTLALGATSLPDWLLLTLVGSAGVAEGLFLPAYSAVLPRVLPATLLQQGNALTTLSTHLSMVLGPAIAGVIVAGSGPSSALWVDAVTFVFSLGTLVLLREPRLSVAGSGQAPGRGAALRQLGGDFAEGVRAVLSRPWIAATTGVATVVMVLVTAPSLVVLPVEAVHRFGGTGADAYGATLAAMGGGAVIGAFLAGKLRTRWPGIVGLAGTLTIALSVAGLALLPLPGVIMTWAIGGAGVAIFQVLWVTGIQRDVPEHVLTRVMAVDQLVVQGLMPLGYVFTGPLVELIGARTLLLSGAVLVLIVVPLPLLVRGGTTFSTPRSSVQ